MRLNRRVPVGTHGGVRGRLLNYWVASYSIYYTVLCTYANFRSSYRNIMGQCSLVKSGEWILTVAEMQRIFRMKRRNDLLNCLAHLRDQNYITFSIRNNGQIIQYHISDWEKFNTVVEYNAPCRKDIGFFFLPIERATELIHVGKCSEMDVVLDLWLHTVYNDERVSGSDIGPVVYFRNGTGNPSCSYSELGNRWGISKATVGRILKKLAMRDYLSLITFAGSKGSVIYLNGYLSTMFSISDVMVDKEEVAILLNVTLSDVNAAESGMDEEEPKIIVPSSDSRVSKTVVQKLLKKVSPFLAAQGIPCCQCSQSTYKLSRLSVYCIGVSIYQLSILCPNCERKYDFELLVYEEGVLL